MSHTSCSARLRPTDLGISTGQELQVEERDNWQNASAGSLRFVLAPASQAPQTIFGRNLVVNPDAEAGPGNNGSVSIAIPGWIGLSTSPRTITYSSGSFLKVRDIGPENRGDNYLPAGPSCTPTSIRFLVRWDKSSI